MNGTGGQMVAKKNMPGRCTSEVLLKYDNVKAINVFSSVFSVFVLFFAWYVEKKSRL